MFPLVTRSGIPHLLSLLDTIVGKHLLAISRKLLQTGHVGFMNTTATVRRNVQQQHGVITNRLEIDIGQMLQALHLTVFIFMPEPPRTDGNIDFRRIPEQFGRILQHLTTSQILRLVINTQPLLAFRRTGIDTRSQHGGTPLCLTTESPFVAHPADVIAHDSHHSLGLQALDGLVEGIPIIYLFLAVGTFAIGTVEPHFMYFAIVSQQLGQLFDKEFVVAGRVTVTFSVTVPGRKIHAKLHTILRTGVTQFLHHVTLSILPGRRSNRMFCGLGRPQAETVVMFGRQQYHLETDFLQLANPLFGIQIGGVEQSRIFFTIAPLSVGKGIDTKMQKGCQFHLLPFQLLGRRNQTGSHRYFLLQRRMFRELYMFYKNLCFLLGLPTQRQHAQQTHYKK